MSLPLLTRQCDFVLGEGSLYERLRRSPQVELDSDIAHAGLIYDDDARCVLESVHREYLDIGQKHSIPMMASSPTWRANKERVARSRFANETVNRDGVRFMIELRQNYYHDSSPIAICGQCGPQGDGYRPSEAPTTEQARHFHSQQVEELAEGGADILIAQTLPAFGEALGLAMAMECTGLPYIISFVVRPDGTLLDGTALDEAVQRIDDQTRQAPEAFNVNCVHASVFASAMGVTRTRNPGAAKRITGLHANTSAKSPEELDGLDVLDTEAPETFGENIWRLRTQLDIAMLGGCCGTTTHHMEALAILASRDRAQGQ